MRPDYRSAASPVPDHTLMQRLASGNEEAFRLLSERYSLTLYAIAFAIVRNAADAEMVVEKALHVARKKAGHFDPQRGTPRGWLVDLTTARARACIAQARA